MPFESGNYDYNLYYTGDAAARARLGELSSNYGAKGDYYINSLTFNSTGVSGAVAPTEWNLLSNFTTEVTASSGDVVVINNLSGSLINYQAGDFTVYTNIENSSAVAKLNLGTAGMTLFGVSLGAQVPRLVMDMNAVITGNLSVSNQSVLLIRSGTTTVSNTLEVISDSEEVARSAKVQIDDGAKLVANGGTMNIRNLGIVDVDGTIAGKAGIIIYGNGVMNVAGTLDRTEANLRIKDNGYLSVTGNYVGNTNKGIYIENTSGTNGGLAEFSGNTNFYVLDVLGTLKQISGEETTFLATSRFGTNSVFKTSAENLIIKNSTTTIENGNSSFVVEGVDSKISLNNGTLIIAKENAITGTNGNNVVLSTVANSQNNTVTLNSSQTFSKVWANGADITIILNSSAKLFADFEATQNNKIKIYNFAEDSIFVANYADIDDVNNIFVAYSDNGTTIISQLYINSNGWLTALVPEPAQWATILGALTISLIIIRRKKSL